MLERLVAYLEVDLAGPTPLACQTLDWNEIRQCAANQLISFGPHSITHPALPMTSDMQASSEIIGSWNRLKAEILSPIPVFCYPFGAYSAREISILATSEMVGAITTEQRYARPSPFSSGDGPGKYSVPRFAYPADDLGFQQIASGLERVKLGMRYGRDGWSVHPRTID